MQVLFVVEERQHSTSLIIDVSELSPLAVVVSLLLSGVTSDRRTDGSHGSHGSDGWRRVSRSKRACDGLSVHTCGGVPCFVADLA